MRFLKQSSSLLVLAALSALGECKIKYWSRSALDDSDRIYDNLAARYDHDEMEYLSARELELDDYYEALAMRDLVELESAIKARGECEGKHTPVYSELIKKYVCNKCGKIL